jgi:hypothetical protein
MTTSAFDAFAFLERELRSHTEPSKRQNSNKSGRTSRRQANNRRDARAVGGTNSDMRAIYGYDAEHEMCVTTDRMIEAYRGQFGQTVQDYRPTGRYNYEGRVGSV